MKEQQMQKPKYSKLAIFSFVASIISILFVLIIWQSLMGQGSFVERVKLSGYLLQIAISGIILSIISLRNIKVDKLMGSWLAIISLIIFIVLLGIHFAAVPSSTSFPFI